MSDNGNSASPELRNDDVLLDVQHLTKLFAAETNFFGKATSYVHAVDDVSFQRRSALWASLGAARPPLARCS